MGLSPARLRKRGWRWRGGHLGYFVIAGVYHAPRPELTVILVATLDEIVTHIPTGRAIGGFVPFECNRTRPFGNRCQVRRLVGRYDRGGVGLWPPADLGQFGWVGDGIDLGEFQIALHYLDQFAKLFVLGLGGELRLGAGVL